MNKIKYLTALGLGALANFATYAEGAGTPIFNGATTVNDSLTQLKTDLSGWVDAALPILLGIFGVFAIFWLVKFALRIVKGFAKMGSK